MDAGHPAGFCTIWKDSRGDAEWSSSSATPRLRVIHFARADRRHLDGPRPYAAAMDRAMTSGGVSIPHQARIPVPVVGRAAVHGFRDAGALEVEAGVVGIGHADAAM